MISAADVQFYHENGYLLVKSVLGANDVEELRTAVEGVLERAVKTNFYNQDIPWQGDIPAEELKKLVLKGFHDLQYQDAAFSKAIFHPEMVDVLEKIIGPNIQLHHMKMLVKPPENGAAFPMHQDFPYFPHEKHTMLAASIHLDDTDLENGCLHIIPESHKSGELKHFGRHYLDQKEYPLSMGVACPAQAGDVLFFNYLTIHGSGINRSNRTRRNVLIQCKSAEDKATLNTHINWGQGIMIRGQNPDYVKYKRFDGDTKIFSDK